ncbi:cytochrome c oxidase subunit II [Phenylobacterium sp.]|uniref:cytochrome c oxidase subunit II n=1 Tax=Phenylobacterium sp. TaxID=1871053 RepID=UPI002FDAF378
MKSSLQGMRTWVAGAAAGAMTAFWGVQAMAQDLLGQPTPKGIALQPAAAPLKHDAIFFHNAILMPIITIITLFVAALLVWVIVRYNRRANPVPAKFSHNTTIEVIWTLVPVLILVFIAIFSFRLLFAYHDMPRPDLTVKAVGYQWYWGYEYPDHEVGEFISNMMPEDEARATGVPYLLAANEPMVVPVGKTVRVLVTAADVIHSFALPAFGLKTDAIPGRINETWFRAEKEGVYYGQCSELCGVDHAYMPIEIRVVSEAEFEAWVAGRGGNPAGLAASTAAEPVAPTAAEAGVDAAAAEPANEDAAEEPQQTAAPQAAAAAN